MTCLCCLLILGNPDTSHLCDLESIKRSMVVVADLKSLE